MMRHRSVFSVALLAIALVAGCAKRPDDAALVAIEPQPGAQRRDRGRRFAVVRIADDRQASTCRFAGAGPREDDEGVGGAIAF